MVVVLADIGYGRDGGRKAEYLRLESGGGGGGVWGGGGIGRHRIWERWRKMGVEHLRLES